MLKAGFIGAGGRSQGAHYPSVNRLEDDVEMSAACELDEGKLAQVAQKYEFPHTFTDHRKMLDTLDLDVVYCVMNEKWILQPALDCLNAGKHIFIEKPPGATSDETQQLLEAAVANDVYCMVGFQRRFAAVTREAMRRVSEKGPVSLAVTTFNKQMLGGNREFTTTLWNDVCHVVDLLRYMAGGEPVEVTSHRDIFGSEQRNFYTAFVRFDNNVTGVVFGNRASGGRVLRSELHGVGIGCYMKIPEEIEIYENNQRNVMGGWEVDGVDERDSASYEGVLTMHQHFVDCVRNKKVPLTDLRDVIHSIHLVDQIERSFTLENLEAKEMLDERHLQHQITDEQLCALNSDGYFIVADAIPMELVVQLEERVDSIYKVHLDAEYDPYRKKQMTLHDNFFYPNFLGKDQLFINVLDWYKIFPKVWGILGWNIYSYHSHFIITPPRPTSVRGKTSPLGWHQDSGRVNIEIESSPRPRLSVKVVYWLSDCSETGRGNFYVLPGSHLWDTFERPKDDSLPSGATPVCCKPGDAVFFDRRIWHARSENDSDITRKGLFYGYGYRWLRSKDDMTIPKELFEQNDPIRQQLLGGGTNANGHFSPKDVDVPLKVWLEENSAISK